MLTLGYRIIVAVPEWTDIKDCTFGVRYPRAHAQDTASRACVPYDIDPEENALVVATLRDHTEIVFKDHRRAALVGLVEGRHPIPVPSYLMPARITREYGYHNGLYTIAKIKATEYAKAHVGQPIVLFITGLTVAALGAVKGFQEAGNEAIIASYDRDRHTYVAIEP